MLVVVCLAMAAPTLAFPSEFNPGDGEDEAAVAREAFDPTAKIPDFPESTRGKGYPHLFTRKTSSLLAEALHMLHRAKDMRERQWLEAFVHRLRTLAADLERTSSDLPGDMPHTPVLGPTSWQQTGEHPSRALAPQLRDSLPTSSLINKERAPGHPHRGKVFASGLPPDSPLSSTEPLPSVASGPTKSQRFKELTRKKLLQQIFMKIQKLQQLGGSQEDVLKLLKRTDQVSTAASSIGGSAKYDDESDTIGEENGAAAGEIEVDEPPEQLSTVAASPGRNSLPGMEPVLLKTTDATSPAYRHQVSPLTLDDATRSVTPDLRPRSPAKEVPDENDDDLVRQLREERLILVSTVVPSSPLLHSESDYLAPNGVGEEIRNRFEPVPRPSRSARGETLEQQNPMK